MAQKVHTLKATDRAAAASAVRQQGMLPAVLYGHGIKNRVLALDHKSFTRVYKEAGHTTLVNVSLTEGGESRDHKVLIREVQLHPVRGTILHADLYQVRMDEEIRADVPLVFTGESPAVKDLGGVMVRNMDEVELEALPDDLPHDIEVDITTITEFDNPVRIKDLKVSNKVKLLHELDEVVVLVQPPRTQEEIDAELAEEITEDVEGVEGVEDKPEEGEEGESAEGTEQTDETKEATDEKQ